jgi:DNA invertase Pin-like site-specific DNA recombinase
MAVALYARVSTTRQADNELSIPDQLGQMREWCKAKGFSVAAEYVESGASATDDRRAEFQRMIADATRMPSPYEAIVVHSRSRFFRDLYQFLAYERALKRAGVRVLSITQQTAEDPAGEMASRLFSLFDEYQSQENSKHTRRAMLENARQGYWNGSLPPFGYRVVETERVGNRGRLKRRLEVDPVEAATVRRIYELYVHGHQSRPLGMKGIAQYLNQHGNKMRGRPWRAQKVNEILSDTAYHGCFHFNRRDSKTGRVRPQIDWIVVEVPRIVSADAWERAANRRASCDPKMHPPRAASSPAPLVGLLRCGHCGAGMAQASGKSGRYRYYKCTTRLNKGITRCDSRNLPRENTDRQVLAALSERVFTPTRVSLMLKELASRRRAARTVDNGQLLHLRRELDNATTGLQRLYEAVEAGALSKSDTLRARVHKLEARRSDVLIHIAKLKDQQQLASVKVAPARINAFCKALRDRLTDVDSGLGKAYLRLLVDEIRLEHNQLTVRGTYGQVADAVRILEKMKLGEVPSSTRVWRAREDSNPRPPGS